MAEGFHTYFVPFRLQMNPATTVRRVAEDRVSRNKAVYTSAGNYLTYSDGKNQVCFTEEGNET